MQEYHFKTVWVFDAPLEKVWDIIIRVENWKNWWKTVKKSDPIFINQENGIGSKVELRFETDFGYGLDFVIEITDIKKYEYMKGKATGELEGTGEWYFSFKDGKTYTTYLWNVHSNKKWMNDFAFLLGPVFKFNHNLVMDFGRRGLENELAKTNSSNTAA